jgi:hypothetical protein
LFPNGDRLDYCTNGDSKLKQLLDYLTSTGYKKSTHDLIERLMPNLPSSAIQNDNQITNQSRNLFESDSNLTLKELKLYPRICLLVQES